MAYMPFGRHKGKPLVDVPTAYLRWLAVEATMEADLRAAVLVELERRGFRLRDKRKGARRATGGAVDVGCYSALLFTRLLQDGARAGSVQELLDQETA